MEATTSVSSSLGGLVDPRKAELLLGRLDKLSCGQSASRRHGGPRCRIVRAEFCRGAAFRPGLVRDTKRPCGMSRTSMPARMVAT